MEGRVRGGRKITVFIRKDGTLRAVVHAWNRQTDCPGPLRASRAIRGKIRQRRQKTGDGRIGVKAACSSKRQAVRRPPVFRGDSGYLENG